MAAERLPKTCALEASITSSSAAWPPTTGVRATVLDARRLGFGVTVVEDGVRAVNLEEGAGDRALGEMRDAGALVTLAEHVFNAG